MTKRAKHVGRKAMKAQRDREHFLILKQMSRRSPGKIESLDSLTTREISLTRSYRNLSALTK